MEQKPNSYIKDGELIQKDEKYGDEVLLWADFKEGCVCTNCADGYYNYSISFDDFIKFADFIKKVVKDFHKNSEVVGSIHENKELLGGEE